MIGELLHYIPLFRIQQGDTGGIDMKTITNARNFYQEYFPHAKYNELGYSVLNFHLKSNSHWLLEWYRLYNFQMKNHRKYSMSSLSALFSNSKISYHGQIPHDPCPWTAVSCSRTCWKVTLSFLSDCSWASMEGSDSSMPSSSAICAW